MSYYIMPTLPMSMSVGLKKSPVFNTVHQKSVAGINSAISLQPYPTWSFEFGLPKVQGHEQVATSAVAMFFGAFMATAGGANLFLFTDPQDNTVTNAQFGTGDGVNNTFQLSRNIGGSVDIIQNLNGTPTIKVNGSLTTPSSISATGVVVFSTAPASGAILSWAGSFYYLCRFDSDTVDSTRSFTINNGLDQWQISNIKFNSEFAPGNYTYGLISLPGGF